MDTFRFLGSRSGSGEKYDEASQKKNYATANRRYSLRHFVPGTRTGRNYIFGLEGAFILPSENHSSVAVECQSLSRNAS